MHVFHYILFLLAQTQKIASYQCEKSAFDLLIPNDTGGLEIAPEGTACLKHFDSENLEVSVIGVVGPYRSGKSFMLNQLVDPSGRTNVFGVGNTVNPHTIGCRAYGHRGEGNQLLLFVDSAGLFAPSSTEQFDARVVAVLSLISGLVVYNQIGVVHAEELSRFRFIVKYSQPLRDESSKEFKPSLLWVNQDFFLDIVDVDGTEITPTEYLLNSMKELGFLDIPDMFRSVHGFALPLPTLRAEDLTNLDGNPHLRSNDYKIAMVDFRQTIFSLAAPKSLGSEPMKASELSDLLTISVRRLNSDVGIRDLNAMSTLMKAMQNQKLEDMGNAYMEKMNEKIEFPVNEVSLYATHNEVEKEISFTFHQHLMKLKLNTTQIVENESALRTMLSTKIEGLRNENFRKLQMRSESLLKVEEMEYSQDWEQVSLPQDETQMHEIHQRYLHRGEEGLRNYLKDLISEEEMRKLILNFQGRITDIFKNLLRVNRETSKSVCDTAVSLIKQTMIREATKIGNIDSLQNSKRQAESDFSKQCRGPAKSQYYSKLNFTEFEVEARKRIEELRQFWIGLFGGVFYINLVVILSAVLKPNTRIYCTYFTTACFCIWIVMAMFHPTVRYFSVSDYISALTRPILSVVNVLFYGTKSSITGIFSLLKDFSAAYPSVSVALVLILTTTVFILFRMTDMK